MRALKLAVSIVIFRRTDSVNAFWETTAIRGLSIIVAANKDSNAYAGHF